MPFAGGSPNCRTTQRAYQMIATAVSPRLGQTATARKGAGSQMQADPPRPSPAKSRPRRTRGGLPRTPQASKPAAAHSTRAIPGSVGS
jgi:hypothetical protein